MAAPLDVNALLAERPTAELARWRMWAIVAAVLGIAAGTYGALTQHALFAQAYLIGFVFWASITVGSLAMLMLQYLSGGAWGLLSRRVFEASTRNLIILAILFIPIAMHLPVLYSWARPEAATDPDIQLKALYLNRTFFYVRAVLFFLIWGTLAFFLNRWSKEQDGEPVRLPGRKDGRMRMLSGPGLVLYMITITFVSVDWIMSLEPKFFSTIFGLLLLGGQGLSTLAFTILILAMLMRVKPISEVARPDIFLDLGKLMLAFVMLWAYFSVSQLIIIYQGNLPEEIPWYTTRLMGPWAPVSVLVLLGHFCVPFCLLLSRSLKRNARRLAALGVFVLIMRVVDIEWMIAPIFRHNGMTMHWLDFAVTIGMGGVWMFFFFLNLGARALLPAHDPYFKDAMAHVGH